MPPTNNEEAVNYSGFDPGSSNTQPHSPTPALAAGAKRLREIWVVEAVDIVKAIHPILLCQI
ncbi:hypothetical protein ACVIWU_006083 [Bradyrhizobium sp. USDA 4509]